MQIGRTRLAALVLLIGAGGLLACGPKAPKPGQRLNLKGGKGAMCRHGAECASGTCRGYRCTAKVEQLGTGGACTSDDQCSGDQRCDAAANKCSPKLACKAFRARIDQCSTDLYVTFKPGQAGALKRMKRYKRKRFLRRVTRALYKQLCDKLDGGAVFQRDLTLKAALGQVKCGPFAKQFKQGIETAG